MAVVLLDTNLLLLLVVGETDRSLIAKHKRLQAYTVEDFKWLQAEIRRSGLVLCPNVVTETSNLLWYTNSHAAGRIAETLKALVSQFSEIYVQSTLASQQLDYARLGITDVVLIILAQTQAQLITDDLLLALAAAKIGADVINFAHIQAARLDPY